MCCCFILAGSAACAGNDAALSVVCGNGRLNYGEACDGDVFSFAGPHTCSELGYNSPARLACTSSCALDHSPCVASGVCGDGFATPGWEACDGKDNGGETCASLGYHGGRLFCHANCTFEISQCERCGDGVVQPEFGELLETGPGYCLDAGYFGGVMRTDDCLTATLDRCGDYAVIPPAGSLLDPKVALGPGGDIFLSGLTTGAFPGFTHPHIECPRLIEIWDWEQIPGRVVGYRHDHSCVREFLAARAPGQAERILNEGPVAGKILQLQDLDDGWIALRFREEKYELVRLDAAGVEVGVQPIQVGKLIQPPSLQRLPGGGAGLATMEEAGLRLWTLDPRTGAPSQRLYLSEIKLESTGTTPPQIREFEIKRLSALAWLGGDAWLMRVIALYQSSDTLVPILHVQMMDGIVKVKTITTDQFAFDKLVTLEPDEATGGVTLTWSRSDKVKRVVLDLDGEVVTSNEFAMHFKYRIEALGSDGAGGVLVFGTVPVEAAVDPWPFPYPGADRAFAFCRLGPNLELREARFIPSTAANLTWATKPDYCFQDEKDHFDEYGSERYPTNRSYDFRDDTLIVAGVYDTAVGFLDEGGGSILHEGDGLPVHACGVYLLRFR